MKKNTLKFISILLILSGAFYSCTKNGKEDGGEVPYISCPCDEKPMSELQFPQGEAYLFKDFIPEQMNLKIQTELHKSSGTVCWIVFDSKTNIAKLSIGGGAILNVCEICNFPDFAKSWNIPLNGCKVYFEGVNYSPCEFKGGISAVNHFDFTLTILKRKSH